MRLREGVLLAVLCLTLGRAVAQPVPAMSASAVQAAASAVEADPLLPGTEKIKTLRFKDDDEKKKKKPDDDDLNWWTDLLGNLSAGLRVAMWLVGAGLLVWVLLRLRDWLKAQPGSAGLAALPPTHVGTLDIRPESLPDDIGAAARVLWLRGEQRAALSLLYRGALSRLVHTHGVPIRAASTERECLTLAAQRLAPASQAFLVQLVTGWQGVAYARRALPPEALEALCQGFDAQLPAIAAGSTA
ncbi:DUF4129 domain-containing protein [Roseateles asaccharophilus]|uniref:Protein-glutamine gamma-glutamyltransferase-like C-terminal domain-containing protein n=1 Tax=Roseateles asaccharophilus TaxID=582607 RepID=A0ABU2AER1_9BURK|nr:DUF4129 domain-containing protein [Roseateles asaccharophilus]MDR7335701.1 hypothetical protein [Roseateles asaccharophilus]